MPGSSPSRRDEQHIQAVPPLVLSMYNVEGVLIRRITMVKPPFAFDVPKDLRKRVARTELLDSRGVVVSEWQAPWAVNAA